MTYNCPVCGYDHLSRPPRNYHICPCCGTEFGHDDLDVSHETLRTEWVSGGMHWFSRRTPAPQDWLPIVQLLKAGYGYGVTTVRSSKANIVSIAADHNASAWTTKPVSFSLQTGFPQSDRNANGRPALRPCLI